MSHSSTAPAPSPNAPTGAPECSIPWADPLREAAFNHWLARVAREHELVPTSLRAASADASFRRYLRVDVCRPGAALSRIIMDAPPDQEDSAPFVRVAAAMALAGLNVPEVLDWDAAQGFMLLGDLGARTMMEAIQPDDAGPNQPLYLQAVDTLIAWQLASRPGVLPNCDEALLQRELALFPDWYLARHRGFAPDAAALATLEKSFALIVAQNLRAPSVYVHSDFMPRNLMLASPGMTHRGWAYWTFRTRSTAPSPMTSPA
jgi:aminoglycoside/choline kinase family phosphotransferase